MQKKNWLTIGLAIATAAVLRDAAAQAGGQTAPTAKSVPFATMHHIDAGDSPEVIAAKAATVLPRPNQVEWMNLERTFFIHFGPNTFHGVEWGSGHESPAIFNPSALDAEQWVRTVKESGGKLIILVCKHHDGFAMWPSRYTDHSVASSPWRGGKGDVVRDVANAARKYGIELGVYLSPADLYQLRTNSSNPKGLYGDGSKLVESVIPTDPGSFLSDPSRGRSVPAGKPAFHYRVDDYNRYFLNQLYELLTDYGPIREVWFDGANPDRSVEEHYDYEAWYSLIRRLQPKAFIFGKGPDGRWVGNERGIGRTTEWSVIPLPEPPDKFRWPDMTDADLGSMAKLTPGSYLWWYPAEVNMPILNGWFWAPNKPGRTASELVDRYYTSVGRNGNWLLNLSPDDRGLIPDDQVAQLRSMAAVVRATFEKNLLKGARIQSDSSAEAHPATATNDGLPSTWWQPARGRNTGTLTYTFLRPVTFDVISLQEAVDRRGQRIERFTVEALEHGSWRTLQEQTTVGHKRLLRLDKPVEAEGLRVNIVASRLEPSLSELGLYLQPPVVAGPEISQRDARGLVRIETSTGRPMVYTTDGTIPTAGSPRYAAPLNMEGGGTVMAAVLEADNTIGMVGERHLPGLSPIGWRVVKGEGNSSAAIDDNPETAWHVEGTSGKVLPAVLTVDMGKQQTVRGFIYLPFLKLRSGTVEAYRFETSRDGNTWQPAASGNFDNIRNNPDEQQILFPAREARFFRFTALGTVGDGSSVSGAEITVLRGPAS